MAPAVTGQLDHNNDKELTAARLQELLPWGLGDQEQ